MTKFNSRLKGVFLSLFTVILVVSFMFLTTACNSVNDDKDGGVKSLILTNETTKLEQGYNYILTDNITLDHVIDATNYNGTINGDGYTITANIASDGRGTKSIFNTMSGVIKNLNLKNASMVFKVDEGKSLEIRNCRTSGSLVCNYFVNYEDREDGGLDCYLLDRNGNVVEDENGNRITFIHEKNNDLLYGTVGAFVNISYGNVKVLNSINDANISGRKWAGGFIGALANGTAKLEMYECVNNGEITCDTAYGGGLVGRIMSTTSTAGEGEYDNKIIRCINNGDYYGNNAGGGIIGGATSAKTLVEGCVNNGDLYGGVENNGGIGKNGLFGGIVGSATNTEGIYILNCTNYGNVGGFVPFFGGILGQHTSENVEVEVKIENCNNKAKAETYTKALVPGGIGGIVGRSFSNLELIRCYNYTNYTATNSVNDRAMGGLVATATNVKISECGNFGSLNIVNSKMGGLIGYLSGDALIADSFNVGSLITTNVAGMGGLIGLIPAPKNITLINVFSAGTLTQQGVGVVNSIGGLIGDANTSTIECNNVYGLNNFTLNTGSTAFSIAGNDILGEITGAYYVNSGGNLAAQGLIKTMDEVKTMLGKGDLQDTWLIGDNRLFNSWQEFQTAIMGTGSTLIDA